MDGDILLLIHLHRGMLPGAVDDRVVLHVLVGDRDGMQTFHPGSDVSRYIFHNTHDPKLMEWVDVSPDKLDVGFLHLDIRKQSSLGFGAVGVLGRGLWVRHFLWSLIIYIQYPYGALRRVRPSASEPPGKPAPVPGGHVPYPEREL